MNSMKIYVIIIFFMGVSYLKGQDLEIIGPSTVCIDNIYQYSLTGEVPSDAIITWEILGGSYTGANFTINASFVESGLIKVFVYSNGSQLNSIVKDVTVDTPSIEIKSQCSNIFPKMKKDIFSICNNNQAFFYANTASTNTVEWIGSTGLDIDSDGNHASVSAEIPEVYTLTAITTTPNGCTAESIIQIENVELPPISFATIPQGNPSVEICKGQYVYFQKTLGFESVGESSPTITWDFGDGDFSTGESASHQYSNSGSYLVVMEMSFSSTCDCSIEKSISVNVSNGDGIIIECVSPTCENSTKEYCVIGDCQNYEWSVIGGTIASSRPDGTCIEVDWDSVDNSYGTISVEGVNCPNSCTSTEVLIPILQNGELLTSTLYPCLGEKVNFTYPSSFGNDVTWTIEPEAEIISTSRFGISLKFNDTKVYHVTAVVENALLSCESIFSSEVYPKEKLTISHSKLCQGEDALFELGNNVSGHWSLKNVHNKLIKEGDIDGNSFIINTIDLSEKNYKLIIEPDPAHPTFCGTETNFSLQKNIISDIIGSRVVCKDKKYDYTAKTNISQDSNFNWVQNGNSIGNSNNTISEVTWNNTGSLSVQFEKKGECPSNIFEIGVQLIEDLDIIGDSPVCANSIAHYEIASEDQIFEWDINPSSAGSIINGQYTNGVDIQWNNTVSTQSAIITALSTACGDELVFKMPVIIQPPQVPKVESASNVCPNSIVEWHVDGITSFDKLIGEFNNGIKITTNTSVLSLDLSNPEYLALNSPGMHYLTITVVNPNGCLGFSQVISSMNVSLEPQVSLTSPDEDCQICNYGISYNMFLTVQHPVLSTSNFDITWFHDGVPFTPNNILHYTASELGVYYVDVLNKITNCTTRSNILELECGTSQGQLGEVTITTENLEQFGDNDYGGVLVSSSFPNGKELLTMPNLTPCGFSGNINAPTSQSEINLQLKEGECLYFWYVKDPINGDLFFDNEGEFTHYFKRAGYYPVELYTVCKKNGRLLWAHGKETITVPYIPDFDFSINCGKMDYNIDFFNTSTYLTGVDGINTSGFYYDIGWPQISDFFNFGYINGADCMTIYISSSEYPTYKIKKCFNLNPVPTDLVSVQPESGCENTVFNFFANYTGPIKNLVWDFGDGTQSLIKNPQKTFQINGVKQTFNVTLTYQNELGCEYEISKQVTVFPSLLEGEIIIDKKCVLEPTLTFQPEISGNYTYLWNTGETSDNIVATQGGIYSLYVFDGDCAFYTNIDVNLDLELIDFTHEKEVCALSSKAVHFSASGSNNLYYYWRVEDPAGMIFKGYTRNYNLIIKDSFLIGTYQVELTVNNVECKRVFESSFVVKAKNDKPEITAELNCEQQSILLSSNFENTYWSTQGVKGPSITVVAPPQTGWVEAINMTEGKCFSDIKYVNYNLGLNPTNWFSGCFQPCSQDLVDNPIEINVYGYTIYKDGILFSPENNTLIIDGYEDSGDYVAEKCTVIGGVTYSDCCYQSDVFSVEVIDCSPCGHIYTYPEGVECDTIINSVLQYSWTACINKLEQMSGNPYNSVEISATNGSVFNVIYDYTTSPSMVIMKGGFVPTDPFDTEMCFEVEVDISDTISRNCILNDCQLLPICQQFCLNYINLNFSCKENQVTLDVDIDFIDNCSSQDIYFELESLDGMIENSQVVADYLTVASGFHFHQEFNYQPNSSYPSGDIIQFRVGSPSNFYNYPDMSFDNIPNCGSNLVKIDDLEKRTFFEAYPNPSSDIFNLNCSNNLKKLTNQIYVYNITGEQVIVQDVNSDFDWKIDAKKLEQGTYFVVLVSESKEIMQKTYIIIQ